MHGATPVRFLVRLLLFFLSTLVFVESACAFAENNSRHQGLATKRNDWLIVEKKSGETLQFFIEIAADADSRQRGLMFRTELPENGGMLFDFKREQHVSFWMRNTYIPLDLFFLSDNGHIVAIFKQLIPLSDTPISSLRPVRAVLEINGGLADRYNIRKGDIVRHKIFSNVVRD